MRSLSFFDGKNLDFWRIGSKPFLSQLSNPNFQSVCVPFIINQTPAAGGDHLLSRPPANPFLPTEMGQKNITEY
jgi:hypothetical protein